MMMMMMMMMIIMMMVMRKIMVMTMAMMMMMMTVKTLFPFHPLSDFSPKKLKSKIEIYLSKPICEAKITVMLNAK